MTFSAALLLALVGYSSCWNLHSAIGLGIFGLLLVVLSLFVSLWLDTFTLRRRLKRGKQQLLNRATPHWRLVKFLLGGLLIPIAAFAAANLLELSSRQTPMALASSAVRSMLIKHEVAQAERLGNAVLHAQDPTAKVQGILALQTTGSSEALDQLLRILSDDPSVLRDGSEYQALSKALASYGMQAKTRLVQRFHEVSPNKRGAAAPPGDLFDRYFSARFEGLRSEIDSRAADATRRASERERLQVAEAELQQALSAVETDSLPAQDISGMPSFVMQTLLRMSLKQDADLLAFARQTAADTAWSDAVRGQALLLVGKLGGKKDLDALYGYLESPSSLLQARAMQSIAALQSKLSAPAGH